MTSARLAAMVCLLAALYMGVHRNDARRLAKVSDLGQAGQFRAALDESERITRYPEAGRAILLRAYALANLGRDADASRVFAAAAKRDPDNWRIHRDWAFVLARLGARRGARAQLVRAHSLNPRMPVPRLPRAGR